ncbi:PspC domain-containing protein [Streptomyces sp. NPDC101132]|uniref:PspC domain-containing protein n=1 Tax=Streptomyces sp. NPDC101132 TaxID=3366110 RepID=UPI00382666E8
MTEPSDSPTPGSAGAPSPDRGPGRAAAGRAPLRRSRGNRVLAGVCGGLGRHYDMDPVVFRVVLGVLAVTGGVGLIFYGFAWLLLPAEGEEENEARRLLTGRVEGSTLAALLAALVGCAVFLSMLDNGGLGVFSALVILALAGAAHWSQKRPDDSGDTRLEASVAAHVRAEAPPETQAPPVPGGVMSWWRDPLVKDGTTGPVGVGYLWGPPDAAGVDRSTGEPTPSWGGTSTAPRGEAEPRRGGIGGRIFLLALLAGGLGTGLTWDTSPLGTALQTGLACALAVFGLGIAVSSVKGRTGFGSMFLALVTAGLLMGSIVLPREIGTDWMRTYWRPATAAQVQPRYEADTGVATLDLSRIEVPKGQTRAVSAEIGAGKLKVVLPPGVTAETEIDLGLGDIRLPGERADDIQVHPDQRKSVTLAPAAGSPPGGTIELDLKAGVGQVEVARAAS